MTWKRCASCTRAIAVTAFSCEYCGQLCEDVMDFLPKDDRRPAAPPVATFGPGTDDDAPDYAAEATGVPFEWESLTGASTAEVPAPGTPAAPPSRAVADPVATSPTASSSAQADASEEASANADTIASEDEAPDYGLDFLAEERPANDYQVPLAPETPAASPTVGSGTAGKPKSLRMGMGSRQLAMVGGGVLAAGALIFTILGMRGAASPEPAATPTAARRAPAKGSAAAKATPASAARTVNVDPNAPRWSRVTDGRWVARGQSAAFEVAATARVHVWMRDVTPVLVVRCEKGNAEAFVYTQSAARMEPQDGDHTVQVSFDGASPSSQRWPDSAEHDALFARNSLEFTRRLTQARTLQFGFTPHNADPVVATFVLDGLEPLLSASARQCGWK